MRRPRSPDRRQLLRALAGLPMLPLGGPLAAATGDGGARPTAIRFTPMRAPGLDDPAAMAALTVGSGLEATYADGSRRAWKLAHETLFVTGDRVPDGRGGETVAGGCVDIGGRPIVDRSVPGAGHQFFSDCPDGMTLLTLPDAAVPGVRGNAVFAVVQFEYVSRDGSGRRLDAPLPAPLAVLTLDQDPATGRLSLVQYRAVDTAAIHGLWTPCGASLSPWNTHLGSEEFEPDAVTAATSRWFRGFSHHLYGDPDRASPYRYGHVPEVTVHPDGSGTVRKHYGMGRFSHEAAQVMPDERTVLMGDDWDNGGLFLFVAERPRDLSSGTLYVARWWQTSGKGPGAARLTWIRLGSATSAEIEALVDGGIRAADIVDVKSAPPLEPGYVRIAYEGRTQWVRVRPGMDKAAAFLETHRYAALRGGSLGFTKMEGVALDARDRVAYVAISRIEKPMTDGSGGIRVEGPYSGAVYALNLRGGQADGDGRDIGSDWVPVDMAAVPALVARDYGERGRSRQDALGNFADPDHVATPDNLCFSAALRTLFVGEDSDTHVNNFVWAWHVDRGELVRIASCPAGAEATGLVVAEDVNGWTYVGANFQHPGDWVRGLHDRVRGTLDPLVRANWRNRFGAAVGYLTATPAGIRLRGP